MEAQQPIPDSSRTNSSQEAFRCKTQWQQANNSFIQHIRSCISAPLSTGWIFTDRYVSKDRSVFVTLDIGLQSCFSHLPPRSRHAVLSSASFMLCCCMIPPQKINIPVTLLPGAVEMHVKSQRPQWKQIKTGFRSMHRTPYIQNF